MPETRPSRRTGAPSNPPVDAEQGPPSHDQPPIEAAFSTSSRPYQGDRARHLIAVDRDAPLARFDWDDMFGRRNRVEFEIGSGKGLFLANAALSNPDRNFVGVEVSRKYAEFAALRLAKRGIENARLVLGDARTVIAHGIPDRGLAAVHVYFPDPWWKTRHKKRRIMNEWLLDQLERVLEPGGEFFFATDVAEYFAVVERLMAGRPRFVRAPWREAVNPELASAGLTSFERKYRVQGRSIHRARYVLANQGGGVEAMSS